jgi:predicted SAM-dependent methyltransferase
MKLDLACGQRTTEGFKGVDICKGPNVDFVVDLDKFPWPWKSNSVDKVVCHQYIEHTKDIIKFMNELWRILKPGATAELTAPYYTSIKCWQDPTHVRAISEFTFLYYKKDWREKELMTHYPISANFSVEWNVEWNVDFVGKPPHDQAFALKHYVNAADYIWTRLTKL